MLAKGIYCFGKVQGVYFRASTVEKAIVLGLGGYVRNESGGSVYIHAEGDERALELLIDWCHQGPPRARVDKVTVEEKALSGLSTFEIRY